MDDQNRSGCNERNIAQWLNLVKTVACAPPQHVIGYPGKGRRRQVKCTVEIILNDPAMGGKCAIYHQCLYFKVAGTGHDGDCRTHRITYNAEMILRCALFCVDDCTLKIIDLPVTQCQRRADFCAMPIIFKNQYIVSRIPNMSGYTHELSHTRT